MSDPESKPIEPATPAAPRPAPIGDYDDSMLSHLGLPFYYRHTPTRALRRTAFWLAFSCTTLLLCGNLLGMPYANDTVVYRIRETLFDNLHTYTTFVEAGRSIFSQFFVFAIIFSGIIAPLFATFSLSSERILGTMEFLRLSPMSTLSIVMGKMFAPVFSLHLFSAGLLLVGSAIGLLSEHSLNDVCFAATIIVLHAAAMHALGAFLAIFTLAFRGFGAVFFLLLIGYIVSAAPLVFGREAGVTYFVFGSPWGAMDQLFWRENRNYWNQSFTPEFAGYEGAVTPFVICSYGIVFTLLVWAASRKLDRPDRNALPYRGWLILWTAVLATGFGTVGNFSNLPANLRTRGWQAAAGIIFVGGLVTCALTLLDHPHSRENLLADECERASGREAADTRRRWRLAHAFFVTALVFITACVLVGIFFHIAAQEFATPADIDLMWRISVAAVVTAVTLAFSFALLIETVTVGYDSLPARAAMVAAGVAIFLFAVFGPIVSFNVAYDRWNRSMSIVEQYYAQNDAAAAKVNVAERLARQTRRLQYLRTLPDYMPYLDDVNSEEDVKAQQAAYREPTRFIWRYHRSALLIYVSIYLSLITALVLWRRRNYAMLRREAHQALGVPERGTASAGATPELARAV